MREYIKKRIRIDGRCIPYPVFTCFQYLMEHDGLSEAEIYEFMETKYEQYQKINQIVALKQSCFLLRHTSYSCGSLSEDLYSLKQCLIGELRKNYPYEFDDTWMESFVDCSS